MFWRQKQLEMMAENERLAVKLSADLDQIRKDEVERFKAQLDERIAASASRDDEMENLMGRYMSPKKVLLEKVAREEREGGSEFAKLSPLHTPERPARERADPVKKRGRPPLVGKDVPVGAERKQGYASFGDDVKRDNQARAAKLKLMHQTSASQDDGMVSQLFGDETADELNLQSNVSANVSQIIRDMEKSPTSQSTPVSAAAAVSDVIYAYDELNIPGGAQTMSQISVVLEDGQTVPLDAQVSIEIYQCPDCVQQFATRDDRDTHCLKAHSSTSDLPPVKTNLMDALGLQDQSTAVVPDSDPKKAPSPASGETTSEEVPDVSDVNYGEDAQPALIAEGEDAEDGNKSQLDLPDAAEKSTVDPASDPASSVEMLTAEEPRDKPGADDVPEPKAASSDQVPAEETGSVLHADESEEVQAPVPVGTPTGSDLSPQSTESPQSSEEKKSSEEEEKSPQSGEEKKSSEEEEDATPAATLTVIDPKPQLP